MLEPEAEDRDPIARLVDRLRARWARWGATSLGANATALAEALLYLALIALIAWLWSTPEADFRYWGF